MSDYDEVMINAVVREEDKVEEEGGDHQGCKSGNVGAFDEDPNSFQKRKSESPQRPKMGQQGQENEGSPTIDDKNKVEKQTISERNFSASSGSGFLRKEKDSEAEEKKTCSMASNNLNPPIITHQRPDLQSVNFATNKLGKPENHQDQDKDFNADVNAGFTSSESRNTSEEFKSEQFQIDHKCQYFKSFLAEEPQQRLACEGWPKIEARKEFLIGLDAILDEQDRNQDKSREFHFEIEKKAQLSFCLAVVCFIANQKPSIDEIFFIFGKGQIDNAIFKEYRQPSTLKAEFLLKIDESGSLDLNFQGPTHLKYLKLHFQSCVSFATEFLEFLGSETGRKCWPQYKSLALSFKDDPHEDFPNKIAKLSSNMFCPTLESVFLCLEGTKLDKKWLLPVFFEFLSQESTKKRLRKLEFIIKSSNIKNFYDDFGVFFHLFSATPAFSDLTLLRFGIPGLVLSDESFRDRFNLLNLKTLRSLDLDLSQTGISFKSITSLANFIERSCDLEFLSLALRDNKIVDLSHLLNSISSKNQPNLKALKLYLHRTGLDGKALTEVNRCIVSLPENLVEFKIDLEENSLESENPKTFYWITYDIGSRLKKLNSCQFHLTKCGLGKAQLLSFLNEISRIQTRERLFCDLSRNHGFWTKEWSESDRKSLEESLEKKFESKTRIDLRVTKRYKTEQLTKILSSLKKDGNLELLF